MSTHTSTDCRTPEGIAVGLVDAVISIVRTLVRDHDLTPLAVQEALADLRSDEDVARLMLGIADHESGTTAARRAA